MLQLLKVLAFLLFSILSSSLLFTGCTTHKQPIKPTKKEVVTTESVAEKFSPITMYVKEESLPFKQGESVTVIAIDGTVAMTQKGEIELSNLEEKRSTFRLTVLTSPAAKIRILNIKPKYADGMWLTAGKYHIEISKAGYKTYEKWIVVTSDKKISVKLKKTIIEANGSVTWQKVRDTFALNGLIIQKQRVHEAEKMTWDAANTYCAEHNSTLYEFKISGFSLPEASELLQLFEMTRPLKHTNTLYWTSTVDPEQESYAKYVNLNSGESSWYKKHGKTYAACQYNFHVDTQQSLKLLAKSLQSKTSKGDVFNNDQALNALQLAIFLKYGNPMIQNVDYDADKGVFTFDLVSQNRNTQGEYLYQKEISIDVEAEDVETMRSQLLDPDFEPIVEFEVTDGQISFSGI